jgi:hypothetical protein
MLPEVDTQARVVSGLLEVVEAAQVEEAADRGRRERYAQAPRELLPSGEGRPSSERQ